MASLYEQCQTAVAEAIRALALEGLADGRVYERIRSYDTGATYPCVEVTVEGLHETLEVFDTDHKEWSFPVRVVILTRGDVDDKPATALYAAWREAILDRFKAGPLLGAAGEIRKTAVDPDLAYHHKGPEWLRIAGEVVVTITVIAARAAA